MAGGTGADFKVYNEYFQMGKFERIAKNINAFGPISSNCLRLIARKLKGNFAYEGLFKEISDVDTRRDITSIASVDDLKMTQGEFISVKLNRKVGPVFQTEDAWKKIGRDPMEMSYIMGQQAGEQITASYLKRGLISVQTALESVGATVHYPGTSANISYSVLNAGNRLLGDASNSIACYVMYSKQWHDLVGTGIDETVNDVATYSIKNGKSYSLGRNVIVTDDTALVNENGVSSGVDSYYCLGLVPDAVICEESEDATQSFMMVDDLENIGWRFRVDYAFNVGVKGHQYIAGTGGSNPTDATLGSPTNWDQVVTSIKNGPGVLIETA